MTYQSNSLLAEKNNEESLASIRVRVLLSAVAGLISGVMVGGIISWKYAPLAAWDTAALMFLLWIWAALHGRDAEQTARLAKREDPGHAVFDILLVAASVVSLGAIGALLMEAGGGSKSSEIKHIAAGIVSVLISWAMVHTVYALRYARIYYKNKGGINFNDTNPPRYTDFIYLAFTIGMTFQVSDTSFTSSEFRKIALRHSLLSYLFGTVIVASTINLIAGLRK